MSFLASSSGECTYNGALYNYTIRSNEGRLEYLSVYRALACVARFDTHWDILPVDQDTWIVCDRLIREITSNDVEEN